MSMGPLQNNIGEVAKAHGLKFVKGNGSRELRSEGVLGMPPYRTPQTFFFEKK